MANIWSAGGHTINTMSGSGTTRTFAYTPTSAGSFNIWMVAVLGQTSITLTSLSQSTGGATGAFTNMLTGLGAFTANTYQLLWGVAANTSPTTVSIGFSSSPTNAPKYWRLECVPAVAFGAGLYLEDLNGSSPFDTANGTPGTNITLFNPGGQYTSGEMFVCHLDISVSASSVNAPYTQSSSSSPLGQSIWNTNYGQGVTAPITTLSGSGSVMGIGTVIKIVAGYIPTVTSEMGIMHNDSPLTVDRRIAPVRRLSTADRQRHQSDHGRMWARHCASEHGRRHSVPC